MLKLDFIDAKDICEVAKKHPEIETITYVGKTDESDFDDYEDIWAWFDVQTNVPMGILDLSRQLNMELFSKIKYDDISLVAFICNTALDKYPETLPVYKKGE